MKLANNDTVRWILPVIVVAQFLCTSLWFAGNAILPDLTKTLHPATGFLANLTSAVQFGFITGTLIFALFTISDRYSPSRVFFTCSIIAGMCNLGMSLPDIHAEELFLFRFLTGFFLAGIYPVGMKIASDHYEQGLGKSLGFLVGALVVGTAFPHLLKSLTVTLPAKYVVFSTSALSALGGITLLLFVPDGPHRKPGQKLDLAAFRTAFHNKHFRSTVFGYFGHMWELYTFWAFVPVMLAANMAHSGSIDLSTPLLSFLIIASGGIACVASGLLSARLDAKWLATICLFLSGLCCLLSPLFLFGSPGALIAFLFFWGLVVIADSPLFSSLVARNAAPAFRGTSLAMVNCIGFSITIVSIQVISALAESVNGRYIYMLLAAGPVLGVIALLRDKGKEIGDH